MCPDRRLVPSPELAVLMRTAVGDCPPEDFPAPPDDLLDRRCSSALHDRDVVDHDGIALNDRELDPMYTTLPPPWPNVDDHRG